jgi:predicted O-methyltransferase YrrM
MRSPGTGRTAVFADAKSVTERPNGWRHDLPGLSFDDFYERYGASCRTKNMLVIPSHRAGRLRFAARLLLGRLETTNKRPFSPPGSSRLPMEFIRLDPWEAGYLYALAQTSALGIVEIGRFHGGSTFLLACANREVPMWSIDIAPRDDSLLRRMLEVNRMGEQVELLVGDSQRDEFPMIRDFDVLFVDGEHTRAGCAADLEQFFPRLRPGGHLVVHDCYPDVEVQQAVLDFLSRHDVEIVRSPYIPSAHWHTSAGSLAHLRKPLRD